MSPLENPAAATELRFFLGLVFNYIIGMLIASGHLDPSVRVVLVSQLVDFTGYVIILVTSGIGLFHLFKTSKKITSAPIQKLEIQIPDQKITQSPPATIIPVQEAPTPTNLINAGTPDTIEQTVTSIDSFLKGNEQK